MALQRKKNYSAEAEVTRKLAAAIVEASDDPRRIGMIARAALVVDRQAAVLGRTLAHEILRQLGEKERCT